MLSSFLEQIVHCFRDKRSTLNTEPFKRESVIDRLQGRVALRLCGSC